MVLSEIVGNALDADLVEKLDELWRAGHVEYILLDNEDAKRRRLRVLSDQGNEYALVLPRTQQLRDGAVLLLNANHAVVVRLADGRWLTLAPNDVAVALELGYFAGNSHWTVRFDGALLRIALQGPEQEYLDRLSHFLSSRRVRTVEDE